MSNLGKNRPASLKRFTLTGQDARIIMDADEDALCRLWRKKRGEISTDPEEALVSELAKASLAANRAQFERRTGRC